MNTADLERKNEMKSLVRRLGIVLSIAAATPALLVACSSGDATKPSASPTPFPTVSENVTWQIEDTTVAATVTRPDDKKVHPAIVFVAGSGPTDRDWNSPLLPGTNGSARLLAEEMAKSGFVTIRYDKRVTGPYAQKNLPLLVGKISMEAHLDELQGAVDTLLSRPDVDPKKIYIIGNSEGTIHALNYQLTRQPKFAGLILTGAPGRSLADVTRGQIAQQVASLANSKEIMAGYDRLMADFMAGKPFVADPGVPEGINTFFQGLYAPINLPFTREFFAVNASPLLSKIEAPVLVMIGKKDVQVDYVLDGGPLETAAKGMSNVTFSYPENANHVLKNETRPREALTGADALTYNASDRVLDADALKTIKDWLAKNGGK
jgi:pimeloyl-ACP methyl ester carboxylesterase